MNSYDNAHELAKSLKNSPEYRSFLTAKKQLELSPPTKKMVLDFLGKQMEYEFGLMSGQSEDPQKVEAIQKLLQLVMLDSGAAQFLQAHMRFQQLMADVYKIIGESVAEGMDFFEQTKHE